MNIYWEENDYSNDESKDSKLEGELTTLTSLNDQKVVGGYDITGNGGGAWSVMFMMRKKLNWFHRQMSKLFLGWVWVDKVNN